MDWKTFVAEIIKAVAWPAATVTIICLLRHPLAKLIPLLRKLKYKDLEAEFNVSKALEKAEKEATNADVITAREVPAPVEHEIDQLKEVAKLSPEAGVLAAWAKFEQELREAIVRLSVGVPVKSPIFRITREFVSRGLLSRGQEDLIRDLFEIRNASAHAIRKNKIGQQEALQFIDLIRPLIAQIRKLQPPPLTK